MDEPAVAELVALAHERRVPVLIHAGRGIPALGRAHRAARRAPPGRAADPRARGDLRPRVAVARAAVAPERAGRHGVVEPGRPRRAVRARAAGEHRVGERLALRPPARLGACWALRCALQAGCTPEQLRGIAGGTIARVLDGAAPADLGAAAGPAGARRSTCCSSAWSANLCARVRAARRRGRPDRVARARAARVRGRRRTGRSPDVLAAVLEQLDRYEAELAPPPPGQRFPVAVRYLVHALCVARTPDVPLPALPGAPPPTRAEAEALTAPETAPALRCSLGDRPREAPRRAETTVPCPALRRAARAAAPAAARAAEFPAGDCPRYGELRICTAQVPSFDGDAAGRRPDAAGRPAAARRRAPADRAAARLRRRQARLAVDGRHGRRPATSGAGTRTGSPSAATTC